MQKKLLFALAAAGAVLVSSSRGSPYAGAVVSYNPGAGYAPGYTNTAAVIGPPSTADSYGDPVDAFDPPWQTSQILSIGSNGWLTVQFDHPLAAVPGKPFGRDFIIFGNSFFLVTNAVDTNYAYIGVPATDGTLAADPAQTAVSVSRDGVRFYRLNPALAPTVNTLFPTGGGGNFHLPVNPGLAAGNFAGATLEGVAGLYQGAAGGASYAIAWAQDTNGNPVSLCDIRYVRIDVLSGRAQVAGFSQVTNTNGARVIVEDFVNNPLAGGWAVFGDTNLFEWDSTNQNLAVTWDSSQPNSYFYRPLGTILAIDDNFTLDFDIQLNDVQTGGTYPPELAVGLFNYAQATNPGFSRSAANTPNLFEFDYFPNNGAGEADITATLVDRTVNATNRSNFYFIYDVLPMNPGVTYHFTLTHAAGVPVISATVLANGQFYTSLPYPYPAAITDFRLDSLSVSSYWDPFGDSHGPYSILAHGTVANFVLTLPPPPLQKVAGALTNQMWQGQFLSRSNWLYALERTVDFQTWTNVSPATAGNGTNLVLQDTAPPSNRAFYRARAWRP